MSDDPARLLAKGHPVIAPSFWSARSPRQRTFLAVALVVIAAVLLVAFIWLPAERARTRIAAQLPALRASVAEMRTQSAEAKALRALPASQAGTSAPLATLIGSGAVTQALPGAKLAALDAKRLRLTLDDASWTALVQWLVTANAVQGLAVEEAEIEALAERGRVRASVVLAAP